MQNLAYKSGFLLLLFFTSCFLKNNPTQTSQALYPYEGLSKKEIKERVGFHDSIDLSASREEAGVDYVEWLDTSFNEAYVGKRKYFSYIRNLALVKGGWGKIGRYGRRFNYHFPKSNDSLNKEMLALFRIIDTQLDKGYRDHVISPEEYKTYYPKFLKKYHSPVSEFTEPNIEVQENSDSLKKPVSVAVDFKARQKVDSFYYHKKDTLITRKNVKAFGDFFRAYTKQTIKFGFYDDKFTKVWLTLKVDRKEMVTQHANMGSSNEEIEYRIE